VSASAQEALLAELADARRLAERLASDLAGVVAASEGSNADDEHDPEGATIGFERAQLTALLAAARRRMAAAERALADVDGGGYGRCAECGDAIPAERLAARPSARECVPCASRRR
jgi:DnaK suppressor protein